MADWKKTKDPTTNKTYYYNTTTNETCWEKTVAMTKYEEQQLKIVKQKQFEEKQQLEDSDWED